VRSRATVLIVSEIVECFSFGRRSKGAKRTVDGPPKNKENMKNTHKILLSLGLGLGLSSTLLTRADDTHAGHHKANPQDAAVTAPTSPKDAVKADQALGNARAEELFARGKGVQDKSSGSCCSMQHSSDAAATTEDDTCEAHSSKAMPSTMHHGNMCAPAAKEHCCAKM
jgi:hypothetical protein